MPLMRSLNPGRNITEERVRGFANAEAVNDWLRESNQTERVLGVVHFTRRGARGGWPGSAGRGRDAGHRCATCIWLKSVRRLQAGTQQRNACTAGLQMLCSPAPHHWCTSTPDADPGVNRFNYLLQVNMSVRYFKDEWYDPNFYYQASRRRLGCSLWHSSVPRGCCRTLCPEFGGLEMCS